MPPGVGAALKPAEVVLLKKWIDEGLSGAVSALPREFGEPPRTR